jgi:hypothetical protein
MPDAGTTISMDNDYTLRVHAEEFTNASHSRSITQLFNFKAAQVTTLAREWISVSGVTSSTQMIIQNFSDIESKEEIREMHAKLVALGGKPPSLEDILPGMDGKKLLSPQKGLNP